jgi:hypothetical protein
MHKELGIMFLNLQPPNLKCTAVHLTAVSPSDVIVHHVICKLFVCHSFVLLFSLNRG